MKRMSILAGHQQVRLYSMLDHIRRTPLTGHRDVVAKMPPEVIGQVLRAALDFPSSQHLETLMIKQKQAAWAFTLRRTQGADVNGIRAAMKRMRPAIAGTRSKFFRLDYFDDPGTPWIRFGIDDV